jgi:pimeloyl-ACP methyl ester carboxylesterase
LWCLVCAGCVGASPAVAPPSGERITVFVPGYQGTFLEKQSDRELVWLTPGDAFFDADVSLALPFEGEGKVRHFGTLEPRGPVTRMIVLPALFDVQLYQPWLEFGAAKLPSFLPFGYDWRQDVRDSGKLLCDRLASLPPRARIDIVAHSMGGLVTLSCLRHAPPELEERVDHLVFAGTPFRGAPGIFEDLQRGTTVFFNTSLLDQEALLTFSSTWQLLPGDAGFFADEAGAPVQVGAFDEDAWVQHGWGAFSNADAYGNPAYRAQLKKVLDAHRTLWDELAQPLELTHTRVMVVMGVGREAKSKLRVRADGSFDWDHPLKAEGDGSVLVSSATPLEWMRAVRLETRESHVTLLNDTGVEEQIARFLQR